MSTKPLRILLSHLKHITSGRHSSFMPIALGYIAAYGRKVCGPENLDIRIVEDPNEFERLVAEWKPDVVGMSHYCWNAELNYLSMRHAKAMLPDVTCIAGGPEFPDNDGECIELLSSHPEIDFFAYGEGEVPFAKLLGRLMAGDTLATLKAEVQEGLMAVHDGHLLKGERPARLMDIDVIPSPFLDGLMDQFFDGEHSPMIQTARGCPYSCTFCNAAQDWYNKIAAFSLDRIRAELDFIAERVKDKPELILAITDSNFGSFKRDVEIAEHIRKLQDTYHWPMAFDFTTGKSQYERILHVSDLMQNRFKILTALQSMNLDTLDVVKRKNMTPEQFHMVHSEIKKRGMLSSSDLIMPMPLETKESFFDAYRMNTEAGIDWISSNTLCMLKGTEMASKACREKYAMQTKWRLVARQHGTYYGETCFEVEEVCIATSTMSFAEYLECRGFGFISTVFSEPQFDIVRRHVRELGLSQHDLMLKIWGRSAQGDSPVAGIYAEYLRQSEGELFDTQAAVEEFYARPENHARLLNGEIGDNLIRRFRGQVFSQQAVAALDFAYECLLELAEGRVTADQAESLREARRWATTVRMAHDAFAGRLESGEEEVPFAFDVMSWYNGRDESGPLVTYAGQVTYRLWWDAKSIRDILNTGVSMYGKDMSLTIPRILEYYDITFFWRKCERVKARVAAE
ncbi:cobalamin B12-binding domain-containing protein [Paramagnetospirillum caucaseum]|uniref:Cobalamin B12-binding domain-containing protein n=1 Tax=Paramagnetospirillum caucaseum TaxID=1244869 RepID=M3A944_9PROT|nr:B12-binding domain-containing radical SAM protein [Paramagnetospirillum caucaseum]EME69308.1 cobalamin B12-binding domain-containing protein [Paramagnetospirillum caucaseum]